MTLNKKHLFWILALIAAISFDQMFFDRPFGINFLIFIILVTLGGLIPLWSEQIKIPWTSYLLLIPAGFFAVMTFLRAEPFTTAFNSLGTITALALFFMTLRNGIWYKYQLRDIIVNGILFILNSFVGGILFFKKSSQENLMKQTDNKEKNNDSVSTSDTDIDQKESKKAVRNLRFGSIAPYLRGVLLALPILAVLTFFLTQADPIFNDRIRGIFSQFSFENLGETLFRMFYILIIAYILLSAYHFASAESQKFDKAKENSLALKPFLGSIESTIILGAVNLLFLMFVILQFNYLFSGGKNISLEGYTYAEYARRGFFELIAVAVISLLLFYVLSIITKREERKQSHLFSALGLALVGLVGIILISAYTRLQLYEAAYGFTRLRTLAHIFMIWIGLLLISVAILEITKNITKLAFVLIIFIVGFGISINVLNIDQFIVQKNITRAINNANTSRETNLDSGYLTTLSNDSVPILVNYFNDSKVSESIRDEIGGVLACKLAMIEGTEIGSWISYHYSRNEALNKLQTLDESLEEYPVSYDMYTWFVEVNGEVRSCDGYNYD